MDDKKRVKRAYKKREYVSEIKTTIYLSQDQHEILNKIAAANRGKNQKRDSSKKKPETASQLIRAAINRCYIQPYRDYYGDSIRSSDLLISP